MKALKTLIKLHKRNVDEARRRVQQLEERRRGLLSRIQDMQNQLLMEMELAASQPEMGHFFGDYSLRIKKQRNELAEAVMAVDKEIELAMEALRLAFGELKKYEIALQNAKERERQEAQRRETIRLDEVGAQAFLRKQTESGE